MSSTNRGSDRVKNDAYYSPRWAVDWILGEIRTKAVDSWCEPFRGSGVIYNAVKEYGMGRGGYAEDIWYELDEGRDYFADPRPPHVDLTITNPPFTRAQEAVEKALSHSKSVIMLLRVNFFGAQERLEFWHENPPSHLFTLSKRPSFRTVGKKSTDSCEYAWFCWDMGLKCLWNPPGMYVLPRTREELEKVNRSERERRAREREMARDRKA